MKSKHVAIRGLLWVIGSYHILVGLMFNGPKDWLVWAGKSLGGITSMPDAGVFYLGKPFGIYLIAFGVAMCMAAWNPVKNRSLISIAVVLFGLRVIQRLLSFNETENVFGISSTRNCVMIAIVALFGIALLIFRIRLIKEMNSEKAESVEK